MSRSMHQADVTAGDTRGARAWIVLVCAFILLVVPVILFGIDNTSESDDQNFHHLLVVRQATESIMGVGDAPSLVAFLKNYPSATSPGYHLALALAETCGLGSTTLLRMISSLFGLALVLSLWKILSARLDGWLAFALTLPLFCSPYFLSGSMWLTTDVAAVLFIVLTLGSLLAVPMTPTHLLRGGLCAALAVVVRQPTIWLIAPLYLAVWLSRKTVKVTGFARFALPALLMLPVGIVGSLIVLWSGIMPVAYRSLHNTGANSATLAFVLSLVGLWGVLWAVALLGTRWTDLKKHGTRWMIAGLILLPLLAIPQTSYNRPEGRWGGPLWSVVHIAPVIMDRSLLLVTLALLGVVVLWVFARAARAASSSDDQSHGWLILAVSVAALVSALTVNSQCWERYVDLPMLAILPLAIMLGVDRSNDGQRRRLIVASCAMAVLQGTMSLWMVYRPTFFGVPLV